MMTITSEAADMIRNCLRRSDIDDPVVQLVEISETPKEIDEAFSRGASQKEIQQIALSLTTPRVLYPLIYPRSHFLWIFTTTIDGFRFASRLMYPHGIRSAMKTGLLDVARRGLVLKDADGTVVLPKR